MADQEEQTEYTQTSSQEQIAPLAQIEQLKMRIEELEQTLVAERAKAIDYMDRAMRAQAEIANIRKHAQQDIALALNEALTSIVYDQLAVLDSFDRAFTTLPPEFEHFTWVEGIGLIQNQLYGVLQRVGVTPIEAHGKQFNPIEHEAVAYDETSNDLEETVTAELQRGYKLHDQVLRPALVKIARASQFEAADNTSTEQTQTSNM